MPPFIIRPATPADVPLVLAMIRELAEFERLAHEVVADETLLTRHLFGAQRWRRCSWHFLGKRQQDSRCSSRTSPPS